MKMLRLQGEFEKLQGICYEFDMESHPLGEGGMGRVFQGYRVVTSSNMRIPVAIKVVYDGMPDSIIERARREATIQMDNDNLIRMYGFVETEVKDEKRGLSKICYYIIMELLVGVTLDDWLKGKLVNKQGVQIDYAGQLYAMYHRNKNEVVVKIIKNILSGIMALHDRGYIHRDIDPTNVMITHDGKIKLIDFGICKQITSLNNPDHTLTTFGAFIGKANYAAPELVRGEVSLQNETTDIYAVGILFYQLCTGGLPFSGTTQELKQAHLYNKIPVRNISHSGIRSIILKATNKKQEQRYASVSEFRVALEHLDFSESIYPGVIKKWIWQGVGIISLLVLLSVVVIFIMRKKKPIDPDSEKLTEQTSVVKMTEESSRKEVPAKEILINSSMEQSSLTGVVADTKSEKSEESQQLSFATQKLSKTTLDVLESKLMYSEDGGVKLIKIRTNDSDWDVRGKASWYDIQKGVDFCRITVSPNTSYKARNNKIVISAGEIKKVVQIIQEPVKVEIASPQEQIEVKPMPVNKLDHVSEAVLQTETKQEPLTQKNSSSTTKKGILLNGNPVDEREFDIKSNKKSDNMIILRGERKSATRVSVGQTLELSFPLENARARISFCRTSVEGTKAMFFYSSTNMKGIQFTQKIDERQNLCRLNFTFSSKGEFVVYVQGRKTYAFIGVD